MSVNPLFELLARVGTALYSPDALTRQDADAVYDDVCALVAEVTRLRGERDAVVAWLHAEAQHMYEAGQDRPAWFTLANRAEAIERGEHRREEEK